MNELMLYRQAIKNLLQEYADLSAADKEVHLDLINGKVWLQHNGTEGDIAQELMAGGVAREDIVLGFRSPAVRVHTGYAVA